jgi:hypothetical protein
MSDHPPPGWVPPDAGAPPPGAQAPPPGPPGGRPGPYARPYGSAAPPWVAPAHKPGVIALRPLSLGDFYDGAFKTIRRNPKAMVGLAALVTLGAMVVPVLITLTLAAGGNLSFSLDGAASGGALSAFDPTGVSLVRNLGTLFEAVATVVLNGMLVRVVAEAVLGRKTSIGQAWAAVRGRLLRLFGLTLLNVLVGSLLFGVPIAVGVIVGLQAGVVTGFAVGGPLVVLGLVAFVWVQVRCFMLAPPALVLERTGVFASLRRATSLSRHQFWRLFGIWLLTALVVGLASEVIAIPLGLIGVSGAMVFPGTGGALALVFSSYLTQVIVGAITTPFTSAVVALQYVDQRIRKEGLDVQLIAAAQQPGGTPR